MATKMPDAGHIYLYAIIQGTEEKDLGVDGLFAFKVHTMCDKGICAVVSNIPATDKLRPERKHLAAHQRVLSHLVQNGGVVLPVSFGTIADNSKGVRGMITKYHKTFDEQIKRVTGKVEMELRVVYEVPNVFEYFVTKYPDLKSERDQVYNRNGEPTREQKISIGQHFEQVQTQDRDDLTGKVEEKLRPPCVELKRSKPRNEKEVMRLSCLLDKEQADRFQSALDEASALFDDNFVFEYSGPLPPYNFVDVRVQI